MADDHSRIRVGDSEIGLMGLKRAIGEIAASHAFKNHEEIQGALLERLSKTNYIPISAKKKRRSLAQAWQRAEN